MNLKKRKRPSKNSRKPWPTRKKIKLAVIFGSLTTRHYIRDIDVCVYSAPTLNFKELLDINARIELEMSIPIDLAEISNLPPSFRIDILRNGILIKGQTSLVHRLLDQAHSELIDLKSTN